MTEQTSTERVNQTTIQAHIDHDGLIYATVETTLANALDIATAIHDHNAAVRRFDADEKKAEQPK